jgi:hypothetical protein
MKLKLFLLLFFPCLAFSQKQDTLKVPDDIVSIFDTCCHCNDKISLVNLDSLPQKINGYLYKNSYRVFGGGAWKCFNSPGNTSYVVIAYVPRYGIDVISFLCFNKKYKFIKRGVYFCDICF